MEHPEARPVGQIIETLGSYVEQLTTPRRNPNITESAKRKRREWLDKWLPLRITHPQLEAAAEDIHAICSQYSKCPARGRTVVIFGENGCGKSRMVKHIAAWARRIAFDIPVVRNGQDEFGPPQVSFAHWPSVVDGFKQDEWAVIEDYEKSALLILDDIGAEHDPSKIGVEKLYILLNRREWKWNIVTTNIAPGAWDEKFERRIASRLFRNAQHIDLSQVPDYSTT